MNKERRKIDWTKLMFVSSYSTLFLILVFSEIFNTASGLMIEIITLLIFIAIVSGTVVWFRAMLWPNHVNAEKQETWFWETMKPAWNVIGKVLLIPLAIVIAVPILEPILDPIADENGIQYGLAYLWVAWTGISWFLGKFWPVLLFLWLYHAVKEMIYNETRRAIDDCMSERNKPA